MSPRFVALQQYTKVIEMNRTGCSENVSMKNFYETSALATIIIPGTFKVSHTPTIRIFMDITVKHVEGL